MNETTNDYAADFEALWQQYLKDEMPPTTIDQCDEFPVLLYKKTFCVGFVCGAERFLGKRPDLGVIGPPADTKYAEQMVKECLNVLDAIEQRIKARRRNL